VANFKNLPFDKVVAALNGMAPKGLGDLNLF